MTTIGRIWSCTTLGGRHGSRPLGGHVIVVHIEALGMLLIGNYEAGPWEDPAIGTVVECDAEIHIEPNFDIGRCNVWRRHRNE